MQRNMALVNAKNFKRVVEIEIEVNHNSSEEQTASQNVLSKPLNIYFNKPFNSNEILSSEYLISSAGNHFYECGLSFYQSLPNRERKFYFNPYWVAAVHLIIVFRCVASLILPDNYERAHVYLGDFTHYLDAKAHINPALILSISALLLTKCLHFWHHIRGVIPEYLKPF